MEGHAPKLLALRIVIIAVFGLLTLQLFRMQIIQGAAYEDRAENNRIVTRVTIPQRGLIYTSDGKQVVENVPTYTAVVMPALIPRDQDDALAADLERLLSIPGGTVKRIIEDGRESINGFDPRSIKDDIDRDTALKLRGMSSRFPGVDVVIGTKRSYLYGDLLGHILGYVGPLSGEDYKELKSQGYRYNDSHGKNGVEAHYEALLRGELGYVQSEVDVHGNEVRRLKEQSAQPARGLVLSLDLDLQRETTRLAAQERSRTASLNVVIIVMDVRNGDILALASVPGYDPNLFGKKGTGKEIEALLTDPSRPLLNHAIAEVYPPGSIFKQITGLAALQENVATPGTTIESKGSLEVLNDRGEFVTNMLDWAKLGVLDFYQGFAMSSDVYFYHLAGGYAPANFRGLGPERLSQYARSFGLGRRSGVDLPGEAAGNVPDPKWKEKALGEPWVLGDTYNFGIGQGYLTTTPLQMLNVTAAIANNGEVLRPHVVKQIVDDKGHVVIASTRQTLSRLPVSPENLRVMVDAMKRAVTGGTAGAAFVPGVAVAGKTGTAEFGRRLADGSYEKTHGWFTGFAPADNPQIAVVTFIEHGGGAVDATPMAQKVLDYYFHRDQRKDAPAPTARPSVIATPSGAGIDRRGQEAGPGDVLTAFGRGAGR